MHNRDQFNKLNATILDKYSRSIEKKDISFNFFVHNDQKKFVEVEVNSAYVNQYPVAKRKKFPLQRREELNISLSNVFNEEIINIGHGSLFVIWH